MREREKASAEIHGSWFIIVLEVHLRANGAVPASAGGEGSLWRLFHSATFDPCVCQPRCPSLAQTGATDG